MASVFDVAAYILEKCSPMTTMKLQKLVYYSQAWSLVWDERSLFGEEIQAWANGPVCPALYSEHQGMFDISTADLVSGDPEELDDSAKETIDMILGYYGTKSSHWLSELTHKEQPWSDARGTLKPGERGTAVISHAAMAEYYGSL